MADSRVPATIDALKSLWSATGATVWDGPVVTGDYSDCLFVGYDGDPDGDFQSAECDSEWAGLGAKARVEEFDIICAVVTLVGDQDMKAARDNAYAQFKKAADAVRADPSLGQAPPYMASVKGGSLFTENNPEGLQMRIVFRVHVVTRI